MRAGIEYAAATFPEKLPHRVERMDATAGKIIIDGNAAAALGCLFGGATVCTWYPITPSSLALRDVHRPLRRAPHRPGDRARRRPPSSRPRTRSPPSAWSSAPAGPARAPSRRPPAPASRSCPSSSASATTPRSRPSSSTSSASARRRGCRPGRCRATSSLCHTNSHGDGKHPVLFPASPEECFTMAQEAFDLAERLQTPVFVLSDLDLGMNNWMADPFPYPEKPFDRGKVLDADGVERLKETWGRYKDLDGDGIPWRTLPGTPAPEGGLLHARLGPRRDGGATRRSRDDYVAEHGPPRAEARDGARRSLPTPVIEDRPGATAGLLAFGTSHYGDDRGARPARARARPRRSTTCGSGRSRSRRRRGSGSTRHERRLRRRAEPRRPARRRSCATRCPSYAARFVSVLQYDGLPLDAHDRRRRRPLPPRTHAGGAR